MKHSGLLTSCLLAVLAALVAVPVLGQGQPTAKVQGLVTVEGGDALPGVTVTFSSPDLQGTREVVTGQNGQYASPPLPPGEYEITFAADGFQTLTQRVRLGANFAVQVDAELSSAAVVEQIVVTGQAAEVISDSNTSAVTVPQEDLELLPTPRTLISAVALAPGVSQTGPNNAVTISGAQSWDNLFTLNGVVLNENLRGQPFDLFIEDAIEETATQQAGVSAEFGRFTGGVVTAISKSGGNDFSASFRTSFDNEDWKSSNEFSPEREDVTNEIYEATFGGRIVRDRLWFFTAGRDREVSEQETTRITNIAFPTSAEEQRLEGKLTAAITPSHNLQGTYIEIQEDEFNVLHGGLNDFGVTVDDGSLDDVRSLPQQLVVANYTGVITNNFFVEATYSEREFTFEGSGGKDQAIDTGTPVFDLVNNVVVNESLFCDGTAIAACRDEERNNEAAQVKGSYFLSTANGGSHDIVFGGETFSDIRAADNHQSPNDLMIWNLVTSEFGDNEVRPLLAPGGTLLMHLPILNPTRGTDIQTDSLFVNDRWRFNERWAFNIGVRYDANDAVNSLGAKVADSDAISPRLGASWDIGGEGRNVLHASLARYVGSQANSIFDSSSPAGSPATFGFIYLGEESGFFDPITLNQIAWDWLFDVCPGAVDPNNTFQMADPFSCPFLAEVDIPGATTLLDDGLNTVSSDEIALGYQRRLGDMGQVRFDYVRREASDFFMTQRDLTTGKGSNEQGDEFDLGFVVNNDSLLRRDYDALTATLNLRFLEGKLRFGGNATWSHLRGNVNGENSGSGPVTSGVGEYPEYTELRWNAPEGDLAADQRLRLRLWALYDVLQTERHHLNLALLEGFSSGTPFEAVGNIDSRPFVADLGYLTPPTSVSYFFTGRGAFETDDVTRTDLAINYSLNFGRFEVFFQPEMINVFNEDSVVVVDTEVVTALDDPATLQTFNPFTETPVEGVHWRRGENFGQPLEEDDLQVPREFRFSVGMRWNF